MVQIIGTGVTRFAKRPHTSPREPAAEAVTEALDVPGDQVGSSRLIGGLPPSALWRRSVL